MRPRRSDRSKDPNGQHCAGDLIAGKYQLIRRLGTGGMGVVWVAHNQVLDVHVAIKLIHPFEASRSKQLLARVAQEARAAARLAHPAICRVSDFGNTTDGEPFIVSELLHGETLADQLESQPRIPGIRAVQLLLPISEGLTVAHAAGIVHRDVKPENIFLSRDGVDRVQPKLLDFGIARFVETDQKITIDGTLLGTPDYMSPEQARGELGVDHRTDIWSLCVVLYELITGEMPFRGENYNALLWSIGHEEPASTTDLGAGDEAFWKILKRGLEKRREERWQAMRDLGEALAYWIHSNGVNVDICGSSLQTSWLSPWSSRPAGNPELPGHSRPRSADVDQLLHLPPSTLGEHSTMPAPPGPVAAPTSELARHRAFPSRTWRWGLLIVASLAGAIGIGLGISAMVLGPAPRVAPSPSLSVPMLNLPTTTTSRATLSPDAQGSGLPSATASGLNLTEDSAARTSTVISASAVPSSAPPARRMVPRRPRNKATDSSAYDFGF